MGGWNLPIIQRAKELIMRLLEVMDRFPDQEACIEHLKKIRWCDKPSCTHWGSVDIVRKKESDIGRIGVGDEFHAYTTIGKEMEHQIINHQEQYTEGEKHTNTTEGFGL